MPKGKPKAGQPIQNPYQKIRKTAFQPYIGSHIIAYLGFLLLGIALLNAAGAQLFCWYAPLVIWVIYGWWITIIPWRYEYLEIRQRDVYLRRDLFTARTRALAYQHISDIKVSSGLFITFLNFGSIEIKTVGDRDDVQFGPIRNPDKVREMIQIAQEAYSVGIEASDLPPST